MGKGNVKCATITCYGWAAFAATHCRERASRSSAASSRRSSASSNPRVLRLKCNWLKEQRQRVKWVTLNRLGIVPIAVLCCATIVIRLPHVLYIIHDANYFYIISTAGKRMYIRICTQPTLLSV